MTLQERVSFLEEMIKRYKKHFELINKSLDHIYEINKIRKENVDFELKNHEDRLQNIEMKLAEEK